MSFREVQLEPGWLHEEFKAARSEVENLPLGLRDQTPARRWLAANKTAEDLSAKDKTSNDSQALDHFSQQSR